MIKIHHITLTQFRNYSAASFDFNDRIVAVCGSNGIGKTNLLDAIYYLGFTKSYFNKPDTISAEVADKGFRICGTVELNDTEQEIVILLRETGKKELIVDKETVSRFSGHIGKIPIVFVAPDDIKLITGASDERRTFIDALIAQLDQDYLIALIRYNKIVQERNKLLKSFAIVPIDEMLLDALDQQLAVYGKQLLQKRILALEELFPLINEIYLNLSDKKENPQLKYMPSTSIENYIDHLYQNRSKDLLLQRTSIGIHKDDIEITMHDLPFKQIASQGQKKSMLFALKLASFEFLKKHKGFEPILLLDDIFEKLDQFRLKRLLQWVCIDHRGQVFMTDTHPERMFQLIKDISIPFQTINL